MKRILLLLTASTLTLWACKKEPATPTGSTTETPAADDDGAAEEAGQTAALRDHHRQLEAGGLKDGLDTTNLPPVGKYVVLFKNSFRAPLADTYTGSADGREAAVTAYERNTKAAIRNHFRPGLINDAEIISWYSVLSTGFYAELSAEKARELYRDDAVKCIAPPITYELETIPVFDTGTKPLFIHGYRSGSGKTKRIWIIDSGGDITSPYLNVDITRSKSYIPGSPLGSNASHGCRVAHTAAATRYGSKNVRGTAEGAKVVLLKAGNDPNIEWDALNNALSDCWIYSKDGDIVNLSFSVGIPGASKSTIALATELEDNLLDFWGYDMPIVIAGGNQTMLASNRSPARLGLMYKDDPLNYNFLYVVANCKPTGTEAQVKARTTAFELWPSSNYGRAIRYGLVGITWARDHTGSIVLSIGTSLSAPALSGMLYGEAPSVNVFNGVTQVLKYKKGGTNYTHLVPTLYE